MQPKESEAYQGCQTATPQMQPTESEAYQGWKTATQTVAPHMQPKESEAFRGWQTVTQTAAPQMQPKESEVFQGWLQAVRESASKQSVETHTWFKAKPLTSDMDKAQTSDGCCSVKATPEQVQMPNNNLAMNGVQGWARASESSLGRVLRHFTVHKMQPTRQRSTNAHSVAKV